MKSLLLKCPNCYSYTMKSTCPKCGQSAVTAHPARYSPDDKYARYRNPGAHEN